jgi:hypothetical protein
MFGSVLHVCCCVRTTNFYTFKQIIGRGKKTSERKICKSLHRCSGSDSMTDLKVVMSRGSAVGIATGYGLDDREVRFRVSVESRIGNFSIPLRPALGPTQPPIQWVLGALSPGVKRQGREAGHSPPTSVEVKKTWIYTSTPTYVFMA